MLSLVGCQVKLMHLSCMAQKNCFCKEMGTVLSGTVSYSATETLLVSKLTTCELVYYVLSYSMM